MLIQIIRYGVVGIANNLLGYLLYLLVTWLWLDPKVVVTLLYPIGAAIAYFGHAKYAFLHKGRHQKPILRYVVAHVIGYLTNILLLHFFVDILALPHQFVQLAAIVIVAAQLFFLLKYFVFRKRVA